ncbi:MAG: DUF58 domain-containing protein [Deltaproteobacteria bacterium]|nr:DUF58 domain-containing protein [Deltaproteobacteria bacterium]
MNFARFNHVLVPQSAQERMAWLNSKRGRWIGHSYRLYLALTPLGRAVLLFWLFAGALGLNVAQTVVYILWAIITGLLLASLLFRRGYALDPGFMVKATTPERVGVGTPLSYTVMLENMGDNAVRDIRVQLPFLTWDGRYVAQRDKVSELLPNARAVLTSTAVFSARGAHSLMPVLAMRELPMGIAAGPYLQSEAVSFVVVPFFPVIHSLRLPFREKCHPGGVPMASHTGEAMELAGVREYRTGDQTRDLHARTWARTGVPHVRQYQQEFFTRMGIILDVYRNGLSEAPFEGAVSLAAGLLARMSNRDALVDILCTGNDFHDLTIGRSVGCFEQGLDLLASVTPGTPLDVEHLSRRLVHHLDMMSGVLIVTSHFSDEVSAIRRWCVERHVPVRVFAVVKRAVHIEEDDVTYVTVADIQQEKGLWL